MTTTQKKTLSNWCRELADVQVSLKTIRECFFANFKGNIDLGFLTGILGELHTLERMEILQRKHPREVRIYRLKCSKERQGQVYIPYNGYLPNILVRTKKGLVVGEVDMVAFIDNIPVILETHLARYKSGSKARLTRMLRQENVEKKKEHLSKLLCQRPEMIYIITQEDINKKENHDSRVGEYIAQGNYVVPFPMNRHQWRATAERLILCGKEKTTDEPESGYKLPTAV